MFATTLLFNKYIKCFAESHFLPDERVLKIVKIARQNCNITTLGGGGGGRMGVVVRFDHGYSL